MYRHKIIRPIALLGAFLANGATAFAQTTPGTPSTGPGGDAMSNMLLLGVSAVVALCAAAFLGKRSASR